MIHRKKKQSKERVKQQQVRQNELETFDREEIPVMRLEVPVTTEERKPKGKIRKQTRPQSPKTLDSPEKRPSKGFQTMNVLNYFSDSQNCLQNHYRLFIAKQIARGENFKEI